MIDYETDIFNSVATQLRSAYTGIYVTAERQRTPPKFPAVQIVEMSNVASTDTQDSASLENHADLMFEVNVFSNLKSGAKLHARGIVGYVDTLFQGLGFARQLLEPIDNADDSVYRYVARYIGRVSQSGVVYQR